MRRMCLLVAAAAALVCRADYKDPSLSVEERVKDLVSRMTVNEKCAQIGMLRGRHICSRENGAAEVQLETNLVERMRANPFGKITQMLRSDFFTRRNWENGVLPHQQAKLVNDIQRIAVEETRLGIPIWFEDEAPHGLMALGEPVYPTGLGLGSTYDKDLLHKIGEAKGRAAHGRGLVCVYAPILDIARDPRWSRVEECFGEDPTLVTLLGEAETKGIAKGGATSCLKHYVGGGLSEGGHNAAPAHFGLMELYNAQLRPFRASIAAGAKQVMCTYHSVDGEPCTSSIFLLDDVLRGHLGFRGFVRADAGAIENAWGLGSVNSVEEAFAASIAAGCDTDYQRNSIEAVGQGWRDAYAKGLISDEVLDRAVSRVLRAKFEMGLFERPYAPEGPIARGELTLPTRDELVLEAARRSLVLLKNNGVLPIESGSPSIAVIGPNAGDRIMNQLGDYSYTQRRQDVVTVLDGVRMFAPGSVEYEKGCSVRSLDKSGFAAAVSLAAKSDVTLLVLGGCSSPFSSDDYDPVNGGVRANTSSDPGNSDKECGEGTDRCTLTYSGVQPELFREIRKVAKKLVVVLIQGRPLEVAEFVRGADAVLLAWYPGSRGGEAIAEAVFGRVNPGGRLPVSLPFSSGQLPVTDDSLFPERRMYIDGPGDAFLPFGYGLSYTTFEYSGFEMIERDNRGVPKRLAVTVKNTGARTGDEIVRFYLTARGTRIQRPWRELIDFVRVTLRPGESKRVFGEVREEFVGHFGRDGKFVPPSASCVYRFSADGCFMPPPTGLSYNPDKGFTWENPSDCVNNTWQRYYRILVASSLEILARDEGDVWDSGNVCWQHPDYGNRYLGRPLEPGRTYWWKVRSSLDFVWTKWSEPMSIQAR